MKNNNRTYGMIVCLIVLMAVLIVTVAKDWIHDPLSLIAGCVAGWALRETLEPIQDEVKNENGQTEKTD